MEYKNGQFLQQALTKFAHMVHKVVMILLTRQLVEKVLKYVVILIYFKEKLLKLLLVKKVGMRMMILHITQRTFVLAEVAARLL